MRPLPIAAVLTVFAILALLVYGVSSGGAVVRVGDVPPDKVLPTLDGEGTGSLADYRGKWVLVNFWASWCEPCREESPALQRYYEENRGRGFVVLGIDSDDLSEDALAFVREFKLTYPQLRDAKGERRKAWGLTGFPESFLLDPDGRVVLARRGPVDEKYMERFVTPFLERGGKATPRE